RHPHRSLGAVDHRPHHLKEDHMPVRHYLWPENNEPLRLTRAFTEHRTCLPQFAGQRIRTLQVCYDDEAIWSTIGSYLTFDNQGHWDRRAAADNGIIMSNAADAKRRAARCKVPDLADVRKAANAVATIRWQPTKHDINRIVAALSGERPIKV